MLTVNVKPEQEIMALDAWCSTMEPHLKKADRNVIQTYAFVKSASTRLKKIREAWPETSTIQCTQEVEVMS